jgi:exosortase
MVVFFFWARRDAFPGLSDKLAWPGLALIFLSIAVRMFGAKFYVDAIDGWSIILWVAGVIWLLGGWRVLRWSLPSVAFLLFMIPLPWRAERLLSLPLQRVATKLSCWALQCLGQPAVAEGNVIYISEIPLYIEEACSGLRIFVATVALAFVYLVLFRRAWWERIVLILSVVPIALVANATRVVITGLLYQYASGEAARKFSHDAAGWLMIVFAATLFWLVLWYLSKLVRDVELVDVGDVIRQEGMGDAST